MLGEAIVLWLGYGWEATPRGHDQALIDRFGQELGEELAAQSRQTLAQFSRTADEFGDDFWEGGVAVAAAKVAHRFRQHRPELPEKTIQALSWAFVYDNK